MVTYNSFEQRQMDQAFDRMLVARAERLLAADKCPSCGGSGRILWGVAGKEVRLQSRPCERCKGSGKPTLAEQFANKCAKEKGEVLYYDFDAKATEDQNGDVSIVIFSDGSKWYNDAATGETWTTG